MYLYGSIIEMIWGWRKVLSMNRNKKSIKATSQMGETSFENQSHLNSINIELNQVEKKKNLEENLIQISLVLAVNFFGINYILK